MNGLYTSKQSNLTVYATFEQHVVTITHVAGFMFQPTEPVVLPVAQFEQLFVRK